MLIYFSQTGNTQLLAQAIKKNVENAMFNALNLHPEHRTKNVTAFYDELKNPETPRKWERNRKKYKKKAKFNLTAGFGKSDNYFKKIIDKVKESIDESNEVIGSFMCQGKMPETVLQRYLKLKEGNHAPDNINLLIDNYYEALKHPNNDDIENLKKAIA